MCLLELENQSGAVMEHILGKNINLLYVTT